jgi:hypothetical protein
MTDYSEILPDAPYILNRRPADSSCAPRSWEAALIYISADDTVDIHTRTYFGGDGYPMEEWLGRVRTYEIAHAKHGECVIDTDRLAEDLADDGKLSVLIDRIVEGRSVQWDGNNHRGVLDDDAQEAEEELTRLLEDGRYVADTEVWDAYEYLRSQETARGALRLMGITTAATDEEIKAVVASMEDEAQSQRFIFTSDPERAVRKVIEEVREEEDEEAA